MTGRHAAILVLMAALLAAPGTALASDYSMRIWGAGVVTDDRSPHVMNCGTPLATPQHQEGAFCIAGYPAAQGVEFTAHPKDGWKFGSWQGRGCDAEHPCTDGERDRGMDPLHCEKASSGHLLTSSVCGFGTDVFGHIWGVNVTFVDNRKPSVTFTHGPPAATQAISAFFQYTANEPGASFECSIDGGGYFACNEGRADFKHAPSAPENNRSRAQITVGPLAANVTHTLDVRAVDSSSDSILYADGAIARYTWAIDTVPPSFVDVAGPGGQTASKSARFTYAVSGGFATSCTLDGRSLPSCSSPLDVTGLSEGAHTLVVGASDAAGNTASLTRSWTVDTIAPGTSLQSGPSGLVASESAVFEFTTTEPPGADCRVDGGPWTPCASPHTLVGLAQGSHLFEVRGRDAAGNVDATPAAQTWTVDTQPPDTEIRGGPEGETTSSEAAFELVATEPAGGFVCELDGRGLPCSSTLRLTGLLPGAHVLSVAAIDRAGRVDPTPARRAWTVAVGLELERIALDGRWRASKLRRGAALQLRGSLTGGSPASVAIEVSNRRLPAARATLLATLPPGAFEVRVPLARRHRTGAGKLAPGTYAVSISGRAGGIPVAAEREARFASPRTGVVVVSRAFATPRRVTASFTWGPEALPRKRVLAVWRQPGGKVVGRYEVKPPQGSTFFRWLDDRRLKKGRWTCTLAMRGKRVVKVSIRVG